MPELNVYKTALLIFRAELGEAPRYLSNRLARIADAVSRHRLYLPLPRHAAGATASSAVYCRQSVINRLLDLQSGIISRRKLPLQRRLQIFHKAQNVFISIVFSQHSLTYYPVSTRKVLKAFAISHLKNLSAL